MPQVNSAALLRHATLRARSLSRSSPGWARRLSVPDQAILSNDFRDGALSVGPSNTNGQLLSTQEVALTLS